jgi:hypothetical protein
MDQTGRQQSLMGKKQKIGGNHDKQPSEPNDGLLFGRIECGLG